MTTLPIDTVLSDIHDKLATTPNLILQAEPGAGKSTRVPLSLLGASFLQGDKIIMLEPRRVAAKSIAHYLASQLGEKVGQRVGYHIRNERKACAETQLEIVTEGILTRRLQLDPELAGVGLIIFDEFHERSVHADLGLMLALEVQQALRDDLKLLVMSATIDSQAIAKYMQNAEVIQCGGRVFPVQTHYQVRESNLLVNDIKKAVIHALQFDDGDILVFLPGQSDINKCMTQCEAMLNTEGEESGLSKEVICLPLYGGLSLIQQERVLTKSATSSRRIIFSTNIAETSLTIEGITTVIDSGLEKTLNFDPNSGMTRLITGYISQASATQRKGRAGRLQHGHCIRLWSEAKHHQLKAFQEEEILTAELTSIVLELSAWGITQYEEANWLTKPPKIHYELAAQLLQGLKLIDKQNKITELGRRALSLGLTPRLASMLLKCEKGEQQYVGSIVAALLSERDIFQAQRSHSNVDIVHRLVALQDYITNKQDAKQVYAFNISVVERVLALATSFLGTLGVAKGKKWPLITLADMQEHAGNMLLMAFPDRVAKSRGDADTRYVLANGKGVKLDDTDALSGERWLVVNDCDAQNKEGRIYSAVSVEHAQIEQLLGYQFVENSSYRLDAKKQKIIGRKRIHYGAITVAEEALQDVPRDAFQTCLKTLIQTEGLSLLNWTKECDSWLARAHWLGQQITSFPAISLSTLIEHIEQWLLPYIEHVSTIKQLKHVNILPLLQANLSWEQQQVLDNEAPTHYITPSNKSVIIRYDNVQGPTVAVILQEMFGELTSPCLANGAVPLRFELLSPARRPIQTTSDLAHFWQHSYFDVAKDMRGKYPKHRWPEQPLLEKPGRSIKRK
ncbi:ATP-dependent helicase HrpB [Flocculibacter collagenilyticus]|uniref:ATP-dependent helicase HrpB n=1 Tax=Flocculibacter collagenilyticus TaxID=2744479 RepID=UPI0018F3BDB7|nr:ATP-dependent helicase HrpB [Flocculibacter collagenilyticus]